MLLDKQDFSTFVFLQGLDGDLIYFLRSDPQFLFFYVDNRQQFFCTGLSRTFNVKTHICAVICLLKRSARNPWAQVLICRGGTSLCAALWCGSHLSKRTVPVRMRPISQVVLQLDICCLWSSAPALISKYLPSMFNTEHGEGNATPMTTSTVSFSSSFSGETLVPETDKNPV